MATSGTSSGALATSTTGYGLYSVDTLSAQLLGEVNQDRNASGGTVPARFEETVRNQLRHLWVMKPWHWMRREATLSIVASTEAATLATDFRKLDSRWIADRSKSGSLWLTFTNNPRDYVAYRARWKSTDTGRPQIALVTRKQTEAGQFLPYVLVAPLPDQAYSMDYVYLPKCPLNLAVTDAHYKGDADVIPMPEDFARGWELYAALELHRKFGKPERYQLAKDAWKDWITDAVAENNRLMVDELEPIRDGYEDLDAMTGNAPYMDPDIGNLPGV